VLTAAARRLEGQRAAPAQRRLPLAPALAAGSIRVAGPLRAVGSIRVHLVDRRQRHERGAGRLLDGLGAAREAVADDEHAAYLKALVSQRLQCPDRRAPGRGHILDEHAAVVAIEQRSLDATREPVLLDLLADEERLDVGA